MTLMSKTRTAPRFRVAALGAGVLTGLMIATTAMAAKPDAPYPFEGTWIRADRVCSASAVTVRTYTAKDVVSARSRCSVRRVVATGSSYQLVEECRHGDRQTVTETIRMSSPDNMTLKRQLVRLKIPRGVRYTRCTIATPPLPHPAH